MTLLHRATAVLALLLACLVATLSPAAAEDVTVTDPKGDTDGYDIKTLHAEHQSQRLRVKLRQSNVPDYYEIRVDVPGGARYEYILYWSIYGERRATVYTRKGYPRGHERCENRSAKVTRHHHLLRFHVSRSCVRNPARLRLKAIAVDDQFGVDDRTGWTPWASAG